MVAMPGDEIQLRAGEWRDLQVTIECVGQPKQPIIIEAEKPGSVSLSGKTRLRIGGQYVIVRNLDFLHAWHDDAIIEFRSNARRLASFCTLEGCRFRDCNPEDLGLDSKIVSLYGSDNRMTHCEIEGKRNVGATVVVWLKEDPARHLLDHNYFGPRERLGKNGGETIRVGDSATSLISAQCRVEENLFEECNGEAEIISNKSCDNLYAHNTFRRCSGALTLRHGHRCRVEGNYFFGESARGSGGVRIIGEDHIVANNLMVGLQGSDQRAAISLMNGIPDSPLDGYSPVVRAQLLFNTLVDCKQSLLIGLVDDDNRGTIPATDCRIIGNIVTSRHAPLVTWKEPRGEILWQANCFWGSPVDATCGADRIEADPLLKLDPLGVYRVRARSPVTAQFNRRLLTLLTDIEGQPRAMPMDLGCDQLSTAEVRFRPLTRDDVGRK